MCKTYYAQHMCCRMTGYYILLGVITYTLAAMDTAVSAIDILYTVCLILSKNVQCDWPNY